MTDPKICLDGSRRTYPTVNTRNMRPGTKFVYCGEIYKITGQLPTRCISDGHENEGPFECGEGPYEPFYGSGGKLLNGAQG